MAARRARRGGQQWALIRDKCVFFSSENLSNTKPIPEEVREEFALGVAPVINAIANYIQREYQGGADIA
jgi:hypothetical protein